jgi:hypothetical protein
MQQLFSVIIQTFEGEYHFNKSGSCNLPKYILILLALMLISFWSLKLKKL